MKSPAERAAFIRAETSLQSPRLLPELRLWLADRLKPLWEATEPDLAAAGLPPPYWAFAWAGGQALARYILDRPDLVRGRRILDFAAGSGLAAIAAMRAGASWAVACDIDPFAEAAIRLNAEANGVSVQTSLADPMSGPAPDASVILAGDVFYEQPMAGRALGWLKGLASGRTILLGDPKRTYFPYDSARLLQTYNVPTTTEIEDSDLRAASVWALI